MSLYVDTNVVRAEIDRRFELAGVDLYDRNHHDRHRLDLPARPLGAHPLAAFVARLVRGRETSTPVPSRRSAPVAPARPRHS